MFNPEQIEGSVWVLGYEDEGEKYFVCRKVFEDNGKQYAIMFSLFDSEIQELEKEDGDSSETCSCCSEKSDEECCSQEANEECCSEKSDEECCCEEDEDAERDIAVLRIVKGVDGEPDVAELTEEEDKGLEGKIEEMLEIIDEEDAEEFDEGEDEK